MGPFFMLRAQEETGADTAQVARAYAVIRALFGTRRLWRDIEALDGTVHAQVQYDSFFRVSRMVRRAVYWFLHRYSAVKDIAVVIDVLEPQINRLLKSLPTVLCGLAKRRHAHDCDHFESIGLPRNIGQRIAACGMMTQLLDIAELANEFGIDAETVARLHFELGRGLGFDWIREQIEGLKVEGRWKAMARGTLRETLGRDQRALVARILTRAKGRDAAPELRLWLTEVNARITRMKKTFDEMQQGEQMDFATLSIALRELGRLV
jgi:glutamate dehydrogenase